MTPFYLHNFTTWNGESWTVAIFISFSPDDEYVKTPVFKARFYTNYKDRSIPYNCYFIYERFAMLSIFGTAIFNEIYRWKRVDFVLKTLRQTLFSLNITCSIFRQLYLAKYYSI